MQYISTRGAAPKLGFEEAMLAGLALDGGLYVPETWPQFSHDEIAALAGLSYEETAYRVMAPSSATPSRGGVPRDHRPRLRLLRPRRAGALVQVGPNEWVMELFHGPTLAFKDVAMQLIGQLFEASLRRSGTRVAIIGATSGDTGSAAIEAFRGRDGVDVFILFPTAACPRSSAAR